MGGGLSWTLWPALLSRKLPAKLRFREARISALIAEKNVRDEGRHAKEMDGRGPGAGRAPVDRRGARAIRAHRREEDLRAAALHDRGRRDDHGRQDRLGELRH